jgi:nucleoside phosphorylase
MIVGESVMGDPHHPEQRLAAGRIDNALAVDMESIGVARAVHRMRDAVDYNPRLLIVRGVSDMVAVADSEDDADDQQLEDANNAQRQEWKPFAATAVALLAGRISARFLADPDPRAAVRSVGQPP